MKTKEFIKRVEELGYKAYLTHAGLWVEEGSELRAVAYVNFEGHFHLNTQDFNFAKLCIEYTETPIEGREERTKFRVRIPDSPERTPVYALCRLENGKIVINQTNEQNFAQHDRYILTEEQIKRNHSYLWQFAEDVE